jgi:uncharacterized protein YkwD
MRVMARVKLARTALAASALPGAFVLLGASCPSAPHAPLASPPLRIVLPPPGHPLSDVYPAPAQPSEPVRRAVFDQINRDRAQAGLSPVAWDAAAARVADAFCAQQVVENTTGHFLRDGIPPYARMGLAGVFGYNSENAASWSTTAAVFSDTPMELALSAHRSMIEETPPQDGHRRTILDAEATHVGVGWALTGGQFRMAQEFLARGLDKLTLETDEQPAKLRIAGAARAPLRIQFVTVAHEPLPVRLSLDEANARTTYSYPKSLESLVPEGQTLLRVVGTVTLDRLRLGRDREFSFNYVPERPGLYTFVFWLSRSGEERPGPEGSAVVRVES